MSGQHFMFIAQQFWPELEDARHAINAGMQRNFDEINRLNEAFNSVGTACRELVAALAKAFVRDVVTKMERQEKQRPHVTANWRHIQQQHAARARGLPKGRR